MGHLLYLLGEINDKTLSKYEKESKRIGKNTFHFAWAMDEDSEERKRGVTVDIAYKYFETEKKKITAMDAPGHRDFIPNMITGTSAADVALLIIDSGKNAFEQGLYGGQTKEHAILARSLGVRQIIVCVNKLEMWEWSRERYDYISNLITDYLYTLDFKKKDVFVLPVSGLQGTNLKEVGNEKGLEWYEGPSLVEIVDNLENPVRELDSPVRFNIADSGPAVIGSLQGYSIFGKLECGAVFEEKEYLIMPLNTKVKIRGNVY
jgi:elongation factor 1 alpha-like protein